MPQGAAPTLDSPEPGPTPPADSWRHVLFLEPRESAPSSPSASRPVPAAKRPSPGHTLLPESAAFFDALSAAGGFDAAAYRSEILLRRQAACLRAIRSSSLADATHAVARHPERAAAAIDAVMIGVTAFFRDRPVFDSLARLLPAIDPVRPGLDILSVGCSDGSELYSLAMLLAEQSLLNESTLLGVDCRQRAIAVAREAVYTAQCAQGVPADLRDRYLHEEPVAPLGLRRAPRAAPLVRVAAPLRAACHWRLGDALRLSETLGSSDMFDVILCRNLAIYLNPAASATMWNALVSRLRHGGILVVGKAERPSQPASHQLIRVAPCAFRKRAHAL